MEQCYIIAGLGNPGAQYARTRHNVGFMALDQLARHWRVTWTTEAKFSARLARVDQDERKIVLCQPRTYMNASGEAIGAILRCYQAPLQNLLVVLDDADLPFGSIRLRPEGSSGGHHGLESIQQHLGTAQFARLRLGIGRNDPA